MIGAKYASCEFMEYAVKIDNLKKTYQPKKGKAAKEALQGISLAIPKGSFYGLLGPNGAGKSTSINIMAGLCIKSGGNVSIYGYDIDVHPRQAKSSIGVVPQELMVDTFFTVREALDFHAGYYGVPKNKRRTDEIIKALHLTEQADTHSRRLSGGMKRRLMVGKALVHNPPVLVLDEPTAGVDVELRTQLWDYVRSLNQAGATVLLTTHYLEEAQELCDHIAIINHGRIVANDSKHNLIQKLSLKRIRVKAEHGISSIPAFLSSIGLVKTDNDMLDLEYDGAKHCIGDVLQAIIQSGIRIQDLQIEQADLEDVFRFYTSHKSY